MISRRTNCGEEKKPWPLPPNQAGRRCVLKKSRRRSTVRANRAKKLSWSRIAAPGNCTKKLKKHPNERPLNWKGRPKSWLNSVPGNCTRKPTRKFKGPASWTKNIHCKQQVPQGKSRLRLNHAWCARLTRDKIRKAKSNRRRQKNRSFHRGHRS